MSTQSLTNADKLQINWMHIIQCIKHEMWPQLASVINAMIENEENKININDLSEKCVESVMKTLKEKRHLPIEERQYLTGLILRAKLFEIECNEYNINKGNLIMPTVNRDSRDYYYNQKFNLIIDQKELTLSLVQDIFDVHRIFVFSNFNFREYSINNYQTEKK
eukprot:466616_1